MQILIYVKSDNEQLGVIKRLIADTVPERQLESYQDVGAFKKRLLLPQTTPFITVIAPRDFYDLGEIVALASLLRDRKVVLVLPDRREDTIRCGHLLWPRFLTFADGPLDWVVEVLNKMLEPKPLSDAFRSFERAAHQGHDRKNSAKPKRQEIENKGQTRPIP